MAPVPLPSSFAEVTDQVEAVDGVRFGQLVTQITDQPGDQLITETLQLAREHITDVEAAEQALIDDWEPRIAAVVAAAEGDPDVAAALEPLLTERADAEDWAALIAVLRRIIAGERGEDLLTGLDPIDAAITRRALDALAGRVELTATPADLLTGTVPEQWDPVIAAVVAAAEGDAEVAAAVDAVLTGLADTQDWVVLVSVLRRIIAGERGQDLLAGLDPVDTAITRTVLDALA
jgi:hypothetical protein